jgi:hypothetical protein
MDKNIDDNDRIVIGVREWAIQEILRDGLQMDRWNRPNSPPDTKAICEIAKRLEEYVLGGIKT